MARSTGPLELQTYPVCANEVVSTFIKRSVDNALSDLYSQPILVDFKVDYSFIAWFTKRTGYYPMERGGADHSALLRSKWTQQTAFVPPTRNPLPINTHRVAHALSQLAEQTEFANYRERADAIEVGPSPKDLPNCTWSTLLDGRTQSRFIQASQPQDSARATAQAILRGLGAERLSKPCTTLYANMVAHDLTHKQVYAIFAATGALSGKFSAMIPPNVILGADFEVPEMGISYKFDVERDLATMYMGDMAFGYTHKLSTLTQWLTEPVYNGPDFSLLFEVVRSYEVMLVFQVTRVTRPSTVSVKHIPGGVGMTRVLDLTATLPYIKRWGDQLYQGLITPKKFLKHLGGLKSFWIPTLVWNKACAFGDARDDKHVNRQAFHSYLNALCYEITVSGHVVQRGYQLAPSAQNSLTMSLLISCMVRRWYSTKALSYLTKEVQSGESSWFQRVCNSADFLLNKFNLATGSPNDIYGFQTTRELTGISRRHFLLLRLIDTVDEPNLDFTGLVKDRGAAKLLNMPCRDVPLTIDPDDDGYCYHHCFTAVYGLPCHLPKNPTIAAIKAFETAHGIGASAILVSNGHATTTVHADSVCEHLVAKVVHATPQLPCKFPITENWIGNLQKFRVAEDSGLNVNKTRELLAFMGELTGSFATIDNLCALPLNDAPAWAPYSVTHHVQSHSPGLPSSKLLGLPGKHSIKFDTNLACGSCIPTSGNLVIADFGQTNPSAAQHIQNLTNLLAVTRRGAYKMQDFFRVCASSAPLTRLILGCAVLELAYAHPWERFVVWGGNLCPGYWGPAGYMPWNAIIKGGGSPAHFMHLRVVSHHSPAAWPPARIAHVINVLTRIGAAHRSRRAHAAVLRLLGAWRNAAEFHAWSHIRACQRELASNVEARRFHQFLEVASMMRQVFGAVVIQRALRRWIRRTHTAPAAFAASPDRPDPKSDDPAGAAGPSRDDVADEDGAGSDQPSPVFNQKQWDAALTAHPSGAALPDVDFSRLFSAAPADANTTDDQGLMAWIQSPTCDVYLDERQASLLWSYTFKAKAHPLYKAARARSATIYVLLPRAFAMAGYHGSLYYAGATLRGLPAFVPPTLPLPVDLDFGAFVQGEEMHRWMSGLVVPPHSKFAKVNTAATEVLTMHLDEVIAANDPDVKLLHSVIRGKVSIINGIPGCGKTRLMLETFTRGGWDLVVCPTNALKQEYSAACVPCKTTVASIPSIRGRSIIIDEAYKMGIIELCYILSHCKKALLVGDSEQTSFNNADYPGAGASRLNTLAVACLGEVPRITVSRAVPLDVMRWIHTRWPEKSSYTTTNCTIDSVKYDHQLGRNSDALKADLAASPLYTDDTKMLCFSKNAEQSMRFLTVNSQQGYRAPLVGLYVGAHCATTIQLLPQQLYVAMTRHTAQLNVYMAAPAARMALDVPRVHACPCRPGEACHMVVVCNDRCACAALAASPSPPPGDQIVGSRSHHGLYGHVAVESVAFDIGPFSSTNTGTEARPEKTFSIPSDASINMQVHGNLHLEGEGFLPCSESSLEQEDEPAPVEVLVPHLKLVSTTAVDHILQRLAPTSSDAYEFRRETGYTNLGDLKGKTLKIKMRQRPLLEPFSASKTSTVSVARCRSRAQNSSLDQALHSAIGRYAGASSRLSAEEFEPEVQRLTDGLTKFIKIRRFAVATPEMLAVAEAEACQNIVAKKNPARQDEGLYGSTQFATSTISCFNKTQDKAGLKTETWMQGAVGADGSYKFKAGQPISASPKTINHVCMAYVRCLELEIIRNRRPGVHLPNGSSSDIFKKHLDRDLATLPPGRYVTMCTDISEQDTTKTSAVHELVKRLFRLIGTPEHVIDVLFSTLKAWAARGLDYTLWSLDAFQSGSAMTYLNNTVDNMARVGSAYHIATPFVAGFKGDDGFIRSQAITPIRALKELKVEEGVTGTFVGYLVGDVLTLDLPRIANKAACRTYRTRQDAQEYATAVADWLHLIPTNEAADHMISLNCAHYGMSRGDGETLWSYLVWYANGGFAHSFTTRSSNHTTGFFYKKLTDVRGFFSLS